MVTRLRLCSAHDFVMRQSENVQSFPCLEHFSGLDSFSFLFSEVEIIVAPKIVHACHLNCLSLSSRHASSISPQAQPAFLAADRATAEYVR